MLLCIFLKENYYLKYYYKESDELLKLRQKAYDLYFEFCSKITFQCSNGKCKHIFSEKDNFEKNKSLKENDRVHFSIPCIIIRNVTATSENDINLKIRVKCNECENINNFILEYKRIPKNKRWGPFPDERKYVKNATIFIDIKNSYLT